MNDYIEFNIPEWNMEILTKELAKLNKKSERLGMNKLDLVVDGEHMIDEPGIDKEYCEINGIPVPQAKVFECKLFGTAVKMADWEFVATLDHKSVPGSVIVNSVPGANVETPTAYFTHDGSCDHCGKKRTRTETFVVHNGVTDEYQAVGRSCIRDFLGHDPKGVVGRLSDIYRIWNVISDVDDEGEERRRGGSWVPQWKVSGILETAAAVIRHRGFVSRKLAKAHYEKYEKHIDTTSSIVSIMLNGPRCLSKNAQKEYRHYVETYVIEDQDRELVVKASEWIRGANTEGNSYLHNLQVLVNAKFADNKQFGYLCSIFAAYEVAMKKLKLVEKYETEREDAEDVPAGNKVVITGVVLKITEKESCFNGHTTWVKKVTIKDDRGFLVWGTLPGKIEDADKGDRITLTAGTLIVSDDSSKFGFFQRPSKPAILERKQETENE